VTEEQDYVRVRFLGNGWNYKVYTYLDSAGNLQPGDTVFAGAERQPAVVIGYGRAADCKSSWPAVRAYAKFSSTRPARKFSDLRRGRV